jgi:hypothetical protein
MPSQVITNGVAKNLSESVNYFFAETKVIIGV